MPLFMIFYGVTFSFLMYVIPRDTGYVKKFILSAGLAAGPNTALLVFAPKFAMTPFGG